MDPTTFLDVRFIWHVDAVVIVPREASPGPD
jgi:hypothetical protein